MGDSKVMPGSWEGRSENGRLLTCIGCFLCDTWLILLTPLGRGGCHVQPGGLFTVQGHLAKRADHILPTKQRIRHISASLGGGLGEWGVRKKLFLIYGKAQYGPSIVLLMRQGLLSSPFYKYGN